MLLLASSSFQDRTPILHIHLLPSSSKPLSPPFTLQSNPSSYFRTSPLFLKSHPLLDTKPLPTFLVQAKSPSDRPNESKWTFEGMIIESLPNGMFRVRLDNEDLILGYISGKIRKNFVRVLPGDRVRVEVSRYDTSKGRIIYRMRGGTGSS